MINLDVPRNVKQHLMRLVPASIASCISCFVFYDNHPCDQRSLDLTVCTSKGEVFELYKRDIVSSLTLNINIKPTEIIAHRNGRSELFYIVKASETLFILSSKPKLLTHKKINSIERYIFEDTAGSGVTNLKITSSDDALPILFDDNFNIVADKFNISHQDREDDIPVHPQLKRKLIEAKFNLSTNENKLKKIKSLRQEAAFALYRSFHPNLDKASACEDMKTFAGSLNINTETVWIKSCNRKVVLCMEISNHNDVLIKDIHILLHGYDSPSLIYTTKVFEASTAPPYWQDSIQQLPSNSCRTLAVVVEVKELSSILLRKEFDGIIVYQVSGEFKFLPFDKVTVSTLDYMGDKFDVLSNEYFDKKDILAILATTNKTDAILRIPNEIPTYNIINDLIEYLNMHKVNHEDCLVIHRHSPYHVLNGVMVHLGDSITEGVYKADIYTRHPSQLISLIHLINDSIPKRILVTTTSLKVSSKNKEYVWNPPVLRNQTTENIRQYSYDIINQMSMILQKYDSCMMKMNEGGVTEKIGQEIDLFAGVPEEFNEFKDNLEVELDRSVASLVKKTPDVAYSEDMIIDSDE